MADMDKILPSEELQGLEELQALVALQRWYEFMGVDDAVSDVPRDYFAEKLQPVVPEEPAAPLIRKATPAPVMAKTEPRARPQALSAASISPEMALAEAEARANAAQDLDELRAAMESYDGCSVKRSAIQLVFGIGAPDESVMVVGETPDNGDDKSGAPFSGVRGVFLNRVLASIGMDKRAYLAQLVPWRPAGNAMPTPHDIDACLPFMHRHITLVQPKLLICLGWTAGKLGVGSGGTYKARGDAAHETLEIPVLILPELNELMRSAARKKKAWEMLRNLRLGN